MGEFELIRQYFAAAACAKPSGNLLLGIGDDCALASLPQGEVLAISTDTLVSGIHFPDLCDPFLLGQRALAVSTSDLAAMGATPLGFTLALTLPKAEADWLCAFAKGLNLMAEQCSMRLMGGDTTRGPLSLTLTVLGHLPPQQSLKRSGASVGDLLCVGGTLGDAAGALPVVLGQQILPDHLAQPLLAQYWSPQPQLALGQALRGRATAALDISDGLLADAAHIAQASGVCLELRQDALPLSPALQAAYGGEQAVDYALSGGDDYRLLFTLPPQWLPVLTAEGWDISVIGRVSQGQGVVVLDAKGHVQTPLRQGYRHF